MDGVRIEIHNRGQEVRLWDAGGRERAKREAASIKKGDMRIIPALALCCGVHAFLGRQFFPAPSLRLVRKLRCEPPHLLCPHNAPTPTFPPCRALEESDG